MITLDCHSTTVSILIKLAESAKTTASISFSVRVYPVSGSSGHDLQRQLVAHFAVRQHQVHRLSDPSTVLSDPASKFSTYHLSQL